MKKYIVFLLIITANLLAKNVGIQAFAQTPQDKDKSVIKIDQLDVIVTDEESRGVIVDQRPQSETDESYIYKKPFIVAPPPPEEEEDLTAKLLQPMDDEGTESEDDILYASFDSEVIHYPKKDPSQIRNVEIELVNPAKGQNFSYPTPETSRVTSHFGPRRRRFHYGTDIAMPTGEPIYAAFDGVVRISKFNRTYGNLIVIRHEQNGLETYYAHLSRRDVQPGDKVKAGEVIGLCGNTGRSYGSHLHFEIRYMGNAMNPENVIDCSTHKLINETLVLNPESFRKVASTSVAKSGSHTSTSSKGGQYYKVRSGDTLSKIAKRNGTTIKRLCQLNGIKETAILSVGKRLRVR